MDLRESRLREPVTVRLQWNAVEAQLTDWRTNAVLGQHLTLQPRQVVFGEY